MNNRGGLKVLSRSAHQPKKTAISRLDPMTGKYQKRSARTVGRRIGTFETGKNERTIQSIAKATMRPAFAVRRRHPIQAASGKGSSIANPPRMISGDASDGGTGSWGA